MRINKYLAEAGICSRREADKLITENKVILNGIKARLGDQVQKGDIVQVAGKKITQRAKKVYILYNKPVGVITTTREGVNSVLDKVHVPERVYPVGRLDVATSGLLLLTNDGRVVNRMLKGKYGHEKEYRVTVDKKVTKMFLEKICKGIVLEKRKTLPAYAKAVGDRVFTLTLTEGRNRQIRRMCEALGYKVIKLVRVRLLHLRITGLQPGSWRHLTDQELHMLFKTLRFPRE